VGTADGERKKRDADLVLKAEYGMITDNPLKKENFSMERDHMKVVITIVGQDRVGIIAMASSVLAENKINILNINQNIVDGFFNMVMIAEMSNPQISLKELQRILSEKGNEMGLDIKVQHEDIFEIMHRI